MKVKFIFLLLSFYILMASGKLALHFDIEPASLPDWNSNTQVLANAYLDLLQNISATKGPLLDLIVDTSISFNFLDIQRLGTTKPLYQWVLDYVDYAMMMDYRNFIDGPNGIITLAQPSVDYATLIGKKVIVGVETLNESPTYITFYGTNTTLLENILSQVKGIFANKSGFVGVAVHHYPSYQQLSHTFTGQCTSKSLFLWHYDVATNITKRAEYLQFAQSRCVKTTYLESEYLINNNNASLASFLTASQAVGIDLQFLYGAADWARYSEHPYVLSLVQKTRAFVESLPTSPPVGSSTSSSPSSSGSRVFISLPFFFSFVIITMLLFI